MTFLRTVTSVLIAGTLFAACGDIEVAGRSVPSASQRPQPAVPRDRPPPGVTTTTRPRPVPSAAPASTAPRTTTTPPTTTRVTVPAPVQTVGGDYHSWPDWPEWQRLGQCEQPGDGPDGIWWTRPGRYEGGLGILNAAWSENNDGLPAHGNQASPGQQIMVGRRIRDRFGWGAWSCARSFGWG